MYSLLEYRISLSPSPIPIERLLVNFVCEVPLPPPGRIQVQLTVGDALLRLQRPSANELPMLDVPLDRLFMCLDIDRVIMLLNALLCEEKVLLHSTRLALLVQIGESLLSLMFPFMWQHVYIPLLPQKLADFAQAPTPFLMGMHSADAAELGSLPGVVVVDLDHNVVNTPHPLPALPARAEKKLKQALRENANVFEPHNPELINADCAFDMAPPPCDVKGDERTKPQFKYVNTSQYFDMLL